MRIVIIIIILMLLISFKFPDSHKISSVELRAIEAYEYCKEEGLNTEFCVLVDMNIHSGKYRLFVYDFGIDSIVSAGLCSHGCCDNEWGEDETKSNPAFSNIPESHCSSIGKYKIGKRGWSNWGVHFNYKLHGLEASNKNAYARTIVLHSWEMVPENEPFPSGTPEGWGCPAVSDSQMRKLDTLFKSSEKPVLFWVYQ